MVDFHFPKEMLKNIIPCIVKFEKIFVRHNLSLVRRFITPPPKFSTNHVRSCDRRRGEVGVESGRVGNFCCCDHRESIQIYNYI